MIAPCDCGVGREHLAVEHQRPACESCEAFIAELTAGGAALCYSCAHAVGSHGADVADAWRARCECPSAHVYPDEMRQRLEAALAALGLRPPRAAH